MQRKNISPCKMARRRVKVPKCGRECYYSPWYHFVSILLHHYELTNTVIGVGGNRGTAPTERPADVYVGMVQVGSVQ